MSEPTKPTVVEPGAAAREDAPAETRVERPSRARVTKPPATSRYEVGDEIARGGMGRVVEAVDHVLDRVVAVKQALTDDPEMLRRFARETKITARLEHPSIVPVYDAGHDGEPFYVMRRVSGRPLAELIAAAPTLADRLALVPHVLASAQAVAHAHQRHIVHRDIKPANILVGEFGETVVIDWGLAKVVGEPDADDPIEASAGDSLRTRVGTVFGTPGFMSPGQLRGEPVGPAGDVYALGATLYFVLAGQPPHHAATGDAMMALAAKGPPIEIGELVPGVPRELSTIVETALAFGPSTYPDARAFAEDLQRFSTGQLVASHRYSRRERLWRFVRRHRAAVAIALAAVAVVIVVGAISISRVLEARDRADAEARQAQAAQARERERADQLLLLRARVLAESNPTEAIAVLKELAPDSSRIAEAHSIANAAMLRGVAWAIEGAVDFSLVAALDATGRYFVQVTKHELVVLDLDTRTRLHHRDTPLGTRAVWIGDRLLVHGAVDTAWLDRTGKMTPLALPRFNDVRVSDGGTRVVGVTSDDQLVTIDLAAARVAPLWPGHRAKAIEIPSDGGWIAAHDGEELVAVTFDGTVLARRKGDFALIRASRSRRLAASDSGRLVHIDLGGARTWEPIDASKFHSLVVMFGYRDEELLVSVATGHFLRVGNHGEISELARPQNGVTTLHEVGDGEIAVLSGARDVLYFDITGPRSLALPHVLNTPRIATVRGRRRVVLSAAEAVVVYDLDQVGPRQLGPRTNVHAVFVDETTALQVSNDFNEMWWLDTVTKRETPIERTTPGVMRVMDLDPSTGRALIAAFRGEGGELVILTKGDSHRAPVYKGAVAYRGRLVRGGVLFSSGRSVFVTSNGVRREVATLRDPVDALERLDDTRFIAMSRTGEVVRGALAGGPLERIQLAPAAQRIAQDALIDVIPRPFAVDREGNALIGWADRVFRWSQQIEQIVALDRTVSSVLRIGNQLYIVSPTTSALLDLSTHAVSAIPSHLEPSWVSLDGRVVMFQIDNRYHVLEPSSRSTWPTNIPKGMGNPALSPRGTRVIAQLGSGLWVWQLPRGEGDVRARLEQLTNASESKDGRLAWPWQR